MLHFNLEDQSLVHCRTPTGGGNDGNIEELHQPPPPLLPTTACDTSVQYQYSTRVLLTEIATVVRDEEAK